MAHSFTTRQAESDFRNRLQYQTGMDFLTTAPDQLPGHGEYQWAVQVAVVASPEPWTREVGTIWGDGKEDVTMDSERNNENEAAAGKEATEESEAARKVTERRVGIASEMNAVLLLRKAVPAGKEPWWELPAGRVLKTDLDVHSAVCRIVKNFCDLTVSEVVGVTGEVQKAIEQHIDGRPKNAVILLRFVVTIKEAPNLATKDNAVIWMNEGHDQFHWVCSSLEVSDWKLPAHIRTSVSKALRLQPEAFYPVMASLGMSPRDLTHQDRYGWKIAAAISRSDISQPPAILVVRRTRDSDSKNNNNAFKLVEGTIDFPGATVEKHMIDIVRQATGLTISKVAGALRGLPQQKSFNDLYGQPVREAVLGYVVEVDEELPKLGEGYIDYGWVEDLRQMSLQGYTSLLDSKEVDLEEGSVPGFEPRDRSSIERALEIARVARRKLLEDGGW